MRMERLSVHFNERALTLHCSKSLPATTAAEAIGVVALAATRDGDRVPNSEVFATSRADGGLGDWDGEGHVAEGRSR